MLGFHEVAALEWGSQRHCISTVLSDLESLVDQLQQASTRPVHNAGMSYNFAFGHSHEPNALENVLKHYATA